MRIIFLKFYFGSYIMIHSLVIAKKDTRNFLVVSPFDNSVSPDLTLQRSIRSPQHSHEEEDDQTRDEICRIIAGSDFIHDIFQVVPTNSDINSKASSVESSTNMTGPCSQREVLIGGMIFRMEVFLCRTWNHVKFVDVFISRPFGVYSNYDFRFVFKENESRKLVTIAIAEDPPTMSSGNRAMGNVTDFFKVLGRLELDSTICNLSRSMKIRLCTMILGAKEYRTDYKILSFTNEPKCNKRNVLFNHIDVITDSGTRISDRCNVNLWTLECEAVDPFTVGFDVPAVFYIFREMNSHTHYIARDEGGIIEVRGCCYI